MELHPDRNPDIDATRRFQDLQRAYDVLSDPKTRAAYDAFAVDPAAARAGSAHPARYEPVYCSRCGSVSAQPRYRVFYSVLGYVIGAVKRPHQGIFCAKCETIAALKATSVTLVFGWWSVPGFFWSIESILTNLVGGPRFLVQDARLLAYQAMYFASIGNTGLARAVAMQAYSLALKASRPNSPMAQKRAKLGYEVDDPLLEIRTQLREFLDSFEGQADAPQLRGASRIWNGRFGAQFGLLAAIIAAAAFWGFVENQRAAEIERARLERAGVARATAAAVAAKRAEALSKLEQPLPRSGIYTLYTSAGRLNRDGLPPFKIKTPAGPHWFLKHYDWQSGRAVLSIFVRAGEDVEVGVPLGAYRIKLASGATWYGENIRFGPDTDYSIIDRSSEFSISGTQLPGHELQLVNVVNGNLRRQPITAEQF